MMKPRIANSGRPAMLLSAMLTVLAAATLALSQSAQTPPATSPNQPAEYETQMYYFGRCGKSISVELAPARAPTDTAALLAFGRSWAEAATVKNASGRPIATFTVPAVRVPTRFTIAHPKWPNHIMGYLVAYPDSDVKWDKNVSLYSCGAPAWFEQWAAATGLPVKQIAADDLASAKFEPSDEKEKSLLIIGGDVADKGPGEINEKIKDRVNILVLGAGWFGDTVIGETGIAPPQMLNGLADIAGQKWPDPLKFISSRKPWPGIANRLAWILDDKGLPLVEQVNLVSVEEYRWAYKNGTWIREKGKSLAVSPSMILSYLPWKEQLGRCESADATLLAVLASAAKATATPFDYYHDWVVTIWPSNLRPDSATGIMKTSLIEPTEQRPILSCVAQGPIEATDMGPHYVNILDLRGKPDLSENSPQQADALKNEIEVAVGPLIILGDDRLIDDWKWLKLDRKKKEINRPGVVWLCDDELPPSKESQVRLMLRLTELGVPLMAPSSGEDENKETGK